MSGLRLSDRQRAFLRALAGENDRGIGAGRVYALAYPDAEYRGRRDAGATRTLDALERVGLVKGHYRGSAASFGGRDWTITHAGRKAIA